MRDLNSKERFSDRVDDYARYRPGYPGAVLDVLAAAMGSAGPWDVADIGSGTGIFAKMLLEAGHRVYGVEPNAPMQVAAERDLSQFERFRSIDGNAEHTNLPAASVDLVTAAQAFHWFDVDSCKIEFARILRPRGVVALIWNMRKNVTPFAMAYEEFLLKWETDYREVGHKNRISEASLDRFFGPSGFDKRVVPNEQVFDFEGLKGRLLSSSYIPKGPGDAFEKMMTVLTELFEKYRQDDRVTFEYGTEIYVGRLD